MLAEFPPLLLLSRSVTSNSLRGHGLKYASLPSLSFTISWSLLKLTSIESVMPSNHLIFCGALCVLPSIFPSIRVFSSELALCLRWPKCWNFSFCTSPSNEYSGLCSSFMLSQIYLSFSKPLFGEQVFLLPTPADKAVYLLWSLGKTTLSSWDFWSWEGLFGCFQVGGCLQKRSLEGWE